MSAPQSTQAVIVGSGAAGGLTGMVLAEAGIDVVMLEAGPRLGAPDFTFDELAHMVDDVYGQKAAGEAATWRPTDGLDAVTKSRQHYGVNVVNAVGGATLHYGGQHFRFDSWNFTTRSSTERRYGPAALPDDCTAVDWPVTYGDLEQWYTAVERVVGVSGAAGNPFEPHRSADYPIPPLRSSGWNQLMAEAGSRLGWHPFQGPAVIDSAKCTYCGYCNYHGCRVDAKGSTFVSVVPRAEKAGAQLITEARVTGVLVDSSGAARGVRYVKDGAECELAADAVVLAAHTWENVRLLLLSRSSAYPDGLGNNHGQVGRNAMTHLYCGFDGLFPGTDLARFNGTVAQAMCFDDLNCDRIDHTDLGFIGGGCISAIQEAHPIEAAMSTPPSVPRWGAGWTSWLAANARSVGRIHATLESLPYSDSLIDLDPRHVDAFGLPVLRMTYRLHEQEHRRWDFFAKEITRLLREAGATETWSAAYPKMPNVPFPSVYGATRMGSNPETSVADEWGMAHEVPNLALTGGGCFPTSGGYNPTATIQALALRTADHLVHNWDAITGVR